MRKNIAVVYNKLHILPFYYYLNDELFKSLELSKHNIKYFGYTDQPAFLKRGHIEFSLCNSFESLHYWLRPFEADTIIAVGNPRDKWGEVSRYEAKKYLLPVRDSKEHNDIFIKSIRLGDLNEILYN